jgi:hypothetical protein
VEDAGDNTRVKLAALAGSVLVGGVLVALALASQSSEPSGFEAEGKVPAQETTDMAKAARLANCELEDFQEEDDGATAASVTYESDPPHSGLFAPEPAQVGAYYDDPPPTEAIVHSLRHSRVVIWFNPDLSEGDKANLKALFDEDSAHMILLPRDSMPYEVAATAWTHRLGCKRLSRETFDALRTFRQRYRDRGPEFVP